MTSYRDTDIVIQISWYCTPSAGFWEKQYNNQCSEFLRVVVNYCPACFWCPLTERIFMDLAVESITGDRRYEDNKVAAAVIYGRYVDETNSVECWKSFVRLLCPHWPTKFQYNNSNNHKPKKWCHHMCSCCQCNWLILLFECAAVWMCWTTRWFRA